MILHQVVLFYICKKCPIAVGNFVQFELVQRIEELEEGLVRIFKNKIEDSDLAIVKNIG